MDANEHTQWPEPRGDNRRPEPTWITLADLGVIVAGVALVLTAPWRGFGWPPFMPPPPLLFVVAIGTLRLALAFALVVALVVLFRRGRYGGPVRPAEWLVLGLASLSLVEMVPNLDEAVNAYYAAVGSNSLDFGTARWLLSAPAALGVVAAVVGIVFLGPLIRDGSRVASALTVSAIVGGLFLWFWGPCEVARLQLPWIVVPGLAGDPSSWGWRGTIVLWLREVVASGPMALAWGLLVAVAVQAWLDDRRSGTSRAWVWTGRAAFADAVFAFPLLAVVGPRGAVDLVSFVMLAAGVGLASWWIAGCLGHG